MVMFFRMCNSPATFQSMMDDIFSDLIEGYILIIYMDDIFLFAKTPEELENMKEKKGTSMSMRERPLPKTEKV
jgi:hypothetical protein